MPNISSINAYILKSLFLLFKKGNCQRSSSPIKTASQPTFGSQPQLRNTALAPNPVAELFFFFYFTFFSTHLKDVLKLIHSLLVLLLCGLLSFLLRTSKTFPDARRETRRQMRPWALKMWQSGNRHQLPLLAVPSRVTPFPFIVFASCWCESCCPPSLFANPTRH